VASRLTWIRLHRWNPKSLDPKAARILSVAVVATWEVHRVWEILSTAAWVSGYCKKLVIQKNRVMHI
jgi:hypothetical protein